MSDQEQNGEFTPYHAAVLEAVKNERRHRTVRWGMVTAGICYGLHELRVAIVDWSGSDELWKAIAAVIVAASAPTFVAWKVVSRFKLHIRAFENRKKKYELDIDTTRTSSGLESDGSTNEGMKI